MGPVTFDKTGGPISVNISAGHAQTGSYTFRLWEANVNTVILEKDGDFLNPEDDTYQLPAPCVVNDGRRVQAIIVIALIPPIKQYSAALTILQDGKVLGTIPISGTSDQPSVILNLYATLKGV